MNLTFTSVMMSVCWNHEPWAFCFMTGTQGECVRVCVCDMHALGVSWQWTHAGCFLDRFTSADPHCGTVAPWLFATQSVVVPWLPSSSWSQKHSQGIVGWIRPLFLNGLLCFLRFFSSSTDFTPHGRYMDVIVGLFACPLLVFMLTQSRSRCGKGWAGRKGAEQGGVEGKGNTVLAASLQVSSLCSGQIYKRGLVCTILRFERLKKRRRAGLWPKVSGDVFYKDKNNCMKNCRVFLAVEPFRRRPSE